MHTGQRTEGLAQYDSYVRVLAAEELTPLDETRALTERLRAGEAAPLPWSGSAAIARGAGAGASASVDDAADVPHSPRVLPVGSTDGCRRIARVHWRRGWVRGGCCSEVSSAPVTGRH